MFESIYDKCKNLRGTAGVVIEDCGSSEIFSYNDDSLFPAASVIKLTILWELFRRCEEGDFELHDTVTLLEDHKVGGFGVVKELHAGMELSLKDLSVLMVVLSDNVATNILIDLLGMDRINDTIRSLGLRDTSLQRKMMDGEAKARGLDNYTSPRDVARLLRFYMTSDLLSRHSREAMMDILKRQQCNNKLPLNIPSEVTLAHKTGDLPGTEHDVGVFFIGDKKIITVVMTMELKSNDLGVRFNNDVGELVCAEYMKNQE